MKSLWSFLTQRWIIWMLIVLTVASIGLYFAGQIHMAATVSKYFEAPFSYSHPEIKSSDVETVIDSGRVKQAIFFSKSLAILGGPKIYLRFYDGKIFWADIVAEDKPAIVLQAKKLADGYYGDKIVFPSEYVAIVIVPFVLFILVIIWTSRRAATGLREFVKFEIAALKRPKTRLSDVAGIDEVLKQVRELIEMIKGSKLAKELCYQLIKGILLHGPPGNGKTLLARAIAGEVNAPFLALSGAEIEDKLIGEGASRLRDTWALARKLAKKFGICFIFIDEVEIMGRKRGETGIGKHSAQEQTASQLFTLMDGVKNEEDNIIVIAATNRRDMLDEALLRKGRFSLQIYVGRPYKKGRKAILGVHTRQKPLAEDVDLDKLSGLTPGFSGADIADLVNSAAGQAWRRCKANVNALKKITQNDFLVAIKDIVAGPAKDLDLSTKEKKPRAFHEVGHAIIERYLPNRPNPKILSVIAHEDSLGHVWSPEEKERYLLFMEEYKERIISLLAGREAEKIACKGAFTAGAVNDFGKATEIARKMVYEYTGPQYFGGDLSNISDIKKAELENKVDDILNSAAAEAHKILASPEVAPIFEEMGKYVQTPGHEELEEEEMEKNFFSKIRNLPEKNKN